jgi:hypothetical protein
MKGYHDIDLPVRPEQIKNIHVLKSALGIDDDTYRAALAQFTKNGKPVESSKELTESQAYQLVAGWNDQATKAGLRVNLYHDQPRKVASAGQVDKLRYHAIRCAIRYAPMPIYNVNLNGGEQVFLEGHELRAWCLRRWKLKAALPQNLLRQLFSTWINPKGNQFLIDGGYRKYEPPQLRRNNPAVLFYNQLTSHEAQYLISRFREIQEKVEQAETKLSDPQETPTHYN